MKAWMEDQLAAEIIERGRYTCCSHDFVNIRELIAELGPQHGFVPKQAHATLKKWEKKGWYEYGVCLDLGWLTDEGFRHFKGGE